MLEALRIVVVAPDLDITNPEDTHALQQAERSRSLRIALLDNRFNLVAVLPAETFPQERLSQLQADLIILDAESEARAAVAAGVSAYIVAGLSPQRIRPFLDVAMARFENEEALRAELAQVRTEVMDLNAELKNRRIIDRAKGLLVHRKGLSESVAYEKLRKTAMDKNLKVVDVAQRMLDAADRLG